MNNKLLIISLLTSSLIASDTTLINKSLEELLNTDIQTKAHLGTRDKARDYLTSYAPVDVITLAQIESSGVTRVTDLLHYYIAGFVVASFSLTDGTDHIVSYSLRGMGADQILVLVNGKRYHSSSILSTVGLFSKGQSFVDLNSIPLVAINRVEILRDGAAAQYGSDAIAGVINIILKTDDKSSLSLHGGIRHDGNGAESQVDSFTHIPLDYDGFLNLSITANNKNSTNRAGLDRRVNPPRVTTHFGLPDSKAIGAVINSEVVSEDNNIFYTDIILNYKESEASTFFRVPSSKSQAIYPDGFLPMLKDKVLDYSLTFGAKGAFRDGTHWDISNIYGYNSSDFSLRDSMNYDLNASSPTSFNNGTLSNKQNTTNLDLKKTLKHIVLSGGLEYRAENYSIKSGDRASYYGTGSQGFPGYEPSNEVSKNRESYAGYLDTIFHINSKFSTDLALRYENFSDFGNTINYKIAAKYNLTPSLLLRATTSTGFRAPSMSQSSYSYTSSALSGGAISKKGIFQPDNPVSKSLGAKKLDAEKSTHYSLGVVYKPNKNSYLMIDSFIAKVDGRILLSDKQGPTTADQNSTFNQYNVSQAQFFTNIADLQTSGVDIKYNNIYTFENSDTLDTTLWFNYSSTKVQNGSSLSESTIDFLEKILPKESARVLNVYKMSKVAIALNLNYFGSFSQTLGSSDVTNFKPEITTDLNIAYKQSKKLSFSIGGFNIFNVMPDKHARSNKYVGYDGIIPYSSNSQTGVSGAYYYLSMRYKF